MKCFAVCDTYLIAIFTTRFIGFYSLDGVSFDLANLCNFNIFLFAIFLLVSDKIFFNSLFTIWNPSQDQLDHRNATVLPHNERC